MSHDAFAHVPDRRPALRELFREISQRFAGRPSVDGWLSWKEFCFGHDAHERQALYESQCRNVIVRACRIGRVRFR